MDKRILLLLPVLALGLSGCDAVRKVVDTQEGKAIGAGCRHVGRSLEDCYRRNPKVSKTDIYIGWREMAEYMAQKTIETLPKDPDPPAVSIESTEHKPEEEAEDEKPSKDGKDKSGKESEKDDKSKKN